MVSYADTLVPQNELLVLENIWIQNVNHMRRRALEAVFYQSHDIIQKISKMVYPTNRVVAVRSRLSATRYKLIVNSSID